MYQFTIYCAFLFLFVHLPASFQVSVGETEKESCLENWKPYKQETCFRLVKQFLINLSHVPKDYIEAMNMCSSQGSLLITVDSPDKQKSVEDYIRSYSPKENVWLGLIFNDDEKKYQWPHDKVMNFSNWKTGSPKNNTCVEMETGLENFGKWSDALCSKSGNAVLCEKIQLWPYELLQKTITDLINSNGQPETPTDETEELCTDDWVPYRNSCFRLAANYVNHSTAETECQSHKAKLVSIDSPEKQKFLEDYLEPFGFTSDFWIGLRYFAANRKYRWPNGQLINYSNWRQLSPEKYPCVVFETSTSNFGKWSDQMCHINNFILCEKIIRLPPKQLEDEIMDLINYNFLHEFRVKDLESKFLNLTCSNRLLESKVKNLELNVTDLTSSNVQLKTKVQNLETEVENLKPVDPSKPPIKPKVFTNRINDKALVESKVTDLINEESQFE